MTRPAMRLTGLTRRFGAVTAVDDVALDLHPGERHAIIGPNGAGKSTLLALISGQLRPSSGTVELMGSDVTGHSDVHRARLGLARTFQHPSLCDELTVADNAVLSADAPRAGRSRHRATRHEVLEALAAVGLHTAADRAVGALSHGERRRLEIAMALLARPRVLLLDEPTAGMSVEDAHGVATHLAELPDTITTVLVEHHLEVVFALAERITVLHHGAVLMTGEPKDVRESAAVQEAYLGPAEEQDDLWLTEAKRDG